MSKDLHGQSLVCCMELRDVEFVFPVPIGGSFLLRRFPGECAPPREAVPACLLGVVIMPGGRGLKSVSVWSRQPTNKFQRGPRPTVRGFQRFYPHVLEAGSGIVRC